MNRLATSDFLLFCEHDRIQILSALHERKGAPVAIPADGLEAVIEEVLDIGIAERELPGRLLGIYRYEYGCMYINARMAQIALPNTDLVGLRNSTLAHELGHLRIQHHEPVIRAHRRLALHGPLPAEAEAVRQTLEWEADFYAGVFLAPTADLWQTPEVETLLGRQAQGETMASDALWQVAVQLAARFRVTPSLMATRLSHLGLVEKHERELSIASLPASVA